MGGVCSSEVAPCSDPNLIIDVQKVLEDTTWERFKQTHGKIERRFLKRKNFEIQVPIHYFHFEVVDSKVTGRTPRAQGATGLGKPSNGLNNAVPNVGNSQPSSQSLLAGKGLAHGDQTSPGHIGLQTEFNNDTGTEQTYTFQFEKVRTASVEVSYQKGYSIGAKANFSIGLPKVLGDGSIGLEVDRHLEITKATGEKFEESLKTSATSDIKVEKWSRYIATVVMEEQLLVANFLTVVEMTMPAGKAPIYVKDLKTGETNFVRTILSLPSVFKKFRTGWTKVMDDEGNERTDAVRFTVEGIIDGIQLSTHKIHLQSVPLIRKEEAGTEAANKQGKASEELIKI